MFNQEYLRQLLAYDYRLQTGFINKPSAVKELFNLDEKTYLELQVELGYSTGPNGIDFWLNDGQAMEIILRDARLAKTLTNKATAIQNAFDLSDENLKHLIQMIGDKYDNPAEEIPVEEVSLNVDDFLRLAEMENKIYASFFTSLDHYRELFHLADEDVAKIEAKIQATLE